MEGKSKGLRKKKETHREEGERDCGQTKKRIAREREKGNYQPDIRLSFWRSKRSMDSYMH